MSGHSKWVNIKNRKAAQDKKKTAAFTRITREIIAAAKINPDPESPRLKTAIEKARAANMPSANIERAIKRAQGLGDEGKLESATYAGVSPGGAAFVIEAATANKNKTVAELRHIFESHGGRMAETQAALWQFSRRGLLQLTFAAPLSEEQQMAIIEAGAEDLILAADSLSATVVTPEKTLTQVVEALAKTGFSVTEHFIGWLPNEKKALAEKTLAAAQELYEALDNHDDVARVAANF